MAAQGDPPAPKLADTARALFGDLEALIDDGRTYIDAELSYQKTRISFVSGRLKKTAFYLVVAVVLVLAGGDRADGGADHCLDPAHHRLGRDRACGGSIAAGGLSADEARERRVEQCDRGDETDRRDKHCG